MLTVETLRIQAGNCPKCGAPLASLTQCNRCQTTFSVATEDPEALARARLTKTLRWYIRGIVVFSLWLAVVILYLLPYVNQPALFITAFAVFPGLIACICGALAIDFVPIAAAAPDASALRNTMRTWLNERRLWWLALKIGRAHV